MSYSYSIIVALFCFPFLCVILSLPFLFYHYRKYGAISFLRCLIFFSFSFYLLCAYFLVILPLPSFDQVSGYSGNYYNLRPFFVVSEFIMNGEFNIHDSSTYLLIFNSHKYLEPIFNVLLVIPFGVYLRYYFKCGIFKTVFLSFLLSLFFEITQLSGLYFIYSRPYRLFDINDLINNSLGGLIGYIIAPLFSFFLPTREEIDNSDYVKGNNVSIGRRFIALMIDYLIVFFISISVILMFDFKSYKLFYLIINVIYFIFIYYFSNGYTFGKWLLNIKSVSYRIDNKVTFVRCLFKWIFLHGIIINGWMFSFIFSNRFNVDLSFCMIIYGVILFIFVIHFLYCTFFNKTIFYDKLLKLSHSSVIGVDEDSFDGWGDNDEV